MTTNNRRTNDTDDEDDDGGRAPQLSALARMLLDDFPESEPSEKGAPQPVSVAQSRKRLSWSQSPPRDEYQIHQNEPYTVSRRQSPDYATARELVTPAPGRYSRRGFGGTRTSSGSNSSNSEEVNKETEGRNYAAAYGSAIRPSGANQSTMTMQQSTSASAIRWKRAGRGLLGGLAGPPRRGPRRGSDQGDGYDGYTIGEDVEGQSPAEVKEGDEPSSSSSSKGSYGTIAREEVPGGEASFSMMSRRSRRSSPEVSLQQIPRSLGIYTNPNIPEDRSGSPGAERKRSGSAASMSRAAAVAAAAAAAVPQAMAAKDKENMPPPPTFRRPAAAALSFKRLSSAEDMRPVAPRISPTEEKDHRSLVASPVYMSPDRERKHILSIKSNNTPLRPAPPPPKMSMLETVTATAGASATNLQQTSRKQRSVVHVNGKPYRRLDAIGKGGSSKVYKVMAENFKMLALKKVTFTAQDGESAIRGYKGEIDLLRKLAGVDRVIRLYDWEMNDQKQCLTLVSTPPQIPFNSDSNIIFVQLMECGETDLAKVLTLRHGNEDSQMDISFIRYYWREMLLCVEAVHNLNIIHSDLKPANFLLVQGRLKLIDFGIANAIQDDTVNVHRESQVGTLNYMSPEAIIDINASSGKAMASVGAPRLMKLGAPSDIWSLGCILYQMTYGRGPFAHLSSMYQKINAIPDPNYKIEYPSTGIGGVLVPLSLINTIKGCLARDKNERPTIRTMLSENDLFLNPDRASEGVVDISLDNLRLLLENAVNHVRDKGVPDRVVTEAWAKDVYGKLQGRMLEARVGGRR